MTTNYCEVCMNNTKMKRVEIEEEVQIRDVTFSTVHEYDKCSECGELYHPLDDVDKNYLKDYELYREKVGYLQPERIKSIRELYNLTIREFAEILGIGYSTLSNIENGALQNDYQNTLFLFSESPTAMYKIIIDKKEFLSFNLDETIEILEGLILQEEPHLVDLKTKINEKVIYMTQQLNNMQYDIGQILKEYKTEESKKEEKKITWTKHFQNMILQD